MKLESIYNEIDNEIHNSIRYPMWCSISGLTWDSTWYPMRDSTFDSMRDRLIRVIGIIKL